MTCPMCQGLVVDVFLYPIGVPCGSSFWLVSFLVPSLKRSMVGRNTMKFPFLGRAYFQGFCCMLVSGRKQSKMSSKIPFPQVFWGEKVNNIQSPRSQSDNLPHVAHLAQEKQFVSLVLYVWLSSFVSWIPSYSNGLTSWWFFTNPSEKICAFVVKLDHETPGFSGMQLGETRRCTGGNVGNGPGV